MNKPKIYLESSVISFEAARDSKNIHTIVKQHFTHEFWATLDKYDVFISDAVLREIELGDTQAAMRRISLVKDFICLSRTAEVDLIIEHLLHEKALPEKAWLDAAHVAIAAVHRIEYLLTWNMAHLANLITRHKIIDVIRGFSYSCPVILTPEELLSIKNDQIKEY
jgi:hypothetical protein